MTTLNTACITLGFLVGVLVGMPMGYYMAVWAKRRYHQYQFRKSFERSRNEGLL